MAETKDEISVVADQIGSPTNAADLAEAILTILTKISNENVELYHYSNEGVCSWYDFAVAIFEIMNIDILLKSTDSSKYPTIAKRPFYSVLNKNLIKQRYGINISHWKHKLTSDYLKKYLQP